MTRSILWFGLVIACNYDPARVSSDADLPDDGRPPVDEVAMTCPDGYTASGATRYRFVATAASWTAAQRDCDDDGFGTHLAVAPMSEEVTVIDAISSASSTWFGLSNRSGTWRWVDGSAGPALSGDPDRCARFYDGSGGGSGPEMQESNCTTQMNAYVCECDLVEPDPTAF